MKLLKDLIEKSNPVIAEIEIPSRTKEGVKYPVRLRKDGTITCECDKAQFSPTCSHREQAKKKFEEKYGWMWNL